jgi:hypothetical protein
MIDEIPIVKKGPYHIYILIFSVLRSYRISYLFPGALQLLVSSFLWLCILLQERINTLYSPM